MAQIDNLARFAEELQQRGVDVCYEIVGSPHCYQEGLDVGDDFFPMWELTLPENQQALEALDFASIKARRGPGWSIAPRGLD
jgi:hypothetical protein